MGQISFVRRSKKSALQVCRLVAAVAGIMPLGGRAAANTLTWDASGTSASSPVDGSGAWDTSTALWSDGANDKTWVNANNDIAVFGNGGTPGTLSLADDITAGGLTFNSSYSIDTSVHELLLNNATITLINNAAANVSNFAGGSATVTGAGTLTLTGNVDNSGLALTVSNGATVILAKDSNPNIHAIGGDGITINSGGAVQLAGAGGAQIFSGSPVNVNSGGVFDLNGTNQSIAHLSGTGGILMNSAVGTTSTLTFAGTDGDYFGQIQDNAGTGGIVALAVTNAGSQRLESANSYSGGATIANGTLVINVYNALGSGPVTLGTGSNNATLIGNGTNEFTAPVPNPINVNGSGTNIISANGWDPTFSGAITLNNANITLQSDNPLRSNLNITGGITGTGNVTIAVLANGNSQVNISGSPVNNAGTITNNSATGATTISAVIGANVTGLIQNGNGTLTLTGASIYTGSTTVSRGTLDIQNATSLFNASNGNTLAESISIASGSTLKLNETNSSGEWALGTTGGVTISGNGTLQINQTGSAANAGLIKLGDQGNGHNVNLNMTGGTIDIQGGALRNGGFAGGIWTANKASMNIAPGATLDLWDGNTVMVDALTGSGTVTHTSFGDSTNLTVGVNNDVNGPATFAGTITETTGHATSLTKIGAGVQILSGANSYSAETDVNGGTLRVNNTAGSGAGSGPIVVNSGGTLGGNGSTGTAGAAATSITINSGGRIAAGPDANITGTLTNLSTSGVTLNGGSGYVWKIDNGAGAGGASSGWDQIATRGITFSSLSSDSPFTIYITGAPAGLALGSTVYVIATDPAGPISVNDFTYPDNTVLTAGATSSLFSLDTSGFSDANSPVFGAASFQLALVGDGQGQDLALVYNATPEPGTAVLLLAGMAALVMSRQRKSSATRHRSFVH